MSSSKNLEESRQNIFIHFDPAVKDPAGIEFQRRKAIEKHTNATTAVLDLEERLNIAVRWEPGSFEWQEAAVLVANRRFQRVLDHLEALVVSRVFELTRMNLARTGM